MYGFKAKNFQEIKTDLENAFLKEIDPSLRFTPDTVAGVLTGIMANEIAKVWEALYDLYHAQDPMCAKGRYLDILCSLTGTTRKEAFPSSAKALVRLSANTTLPKNTLIQVEGDETAIFQTICDVKNSSNQEAILEIDLEAQSPGAIYAPAGKLTKILTPVPGFLGITNPKDALLGALDETDDELRIRRFLELRATGSGTLEAISSHILAIERVEAVHIEEGEHKFTAYVMGGDENKIIKILQEQKPIGVQFKFLRPEIIKVSLKILLKVKSLLTKEEIFILEQNIYNEVKKLKLGEEFYPSQKLYPILFTNKNILDVIKIEFLTPLKTIKSHELINLENIFFNQEIEAV